MNLRTTIIDGKIINIISEKEYEDNYKMYEDSSSLSSTTAIEIQKPDNTYILPIRSKSDIRPGIYPSDIAYTVKLPDETTQDEYLADKLNIVDYRNINTVKEFLNNNSQIKDMETVILSGDKDSIFVPQMNPNDSPMLKALKLAIGSKKVDFNAYAPRFNKDGDSKFANDQRIIKRQQKISNGKFIEYCENFDIEAELVLRNSHPDVANPMPEEIRITLTKNGGE